MTNARAASGSRKAKSLVRSPAGNVFLFAVLAVMGAFMALPLVYAVVSAFKPLEEFFVFPPRFYVVNPTGDNFTQLFTLTSNLWVPFSRYLFNTLFVAVVGTAGHVIVALSLIHI